MRAFRMLILASLFSVLSGSPQLFSQSNSGTTFVASMNQSLRASRAKRGDYVEFRVVQPFIFKGDVIPEGAKISGHVVVARKVDKKAKLDSQLAVVAEEVSWKQKSVRLSAWIVGFGSIKFSTQDAHQRPEMRLGQRMRRKMKEELDRVNSNGDPMATDAGLFTRSDPDAGSTYYDLARVVRDIRLLRKPQKDIGTLLLHDDGDIYLPRDLLVLMEQIDTVDPPS